MAKAKFPLTLASGVMLACPPDAIAPHGDGSVLYINGASVVVTESPETVLAVLGGADPSDTE